MESSPPLAVAESDIFCECHSFFVGPTQPRMSTMPASVMDSACTIKEEVPSLLTLHDPKHPMECWEWGRALELHVASTTQILIYAERLRLPQGVGGPLKPWFWTFPAFRWWQVKPEQILNTERVLAWIGQITSITPFNVAFRAFDIQSHS